MPDAAVASLRAGAVEGGPAPDGHRFTYAGVDQASAATTNGALLRGGGGTGMMNSALHFGQTGFISRS